MRTLAAILLCCASAFGQTLNVGTANVGTLAKQEPLAPDTSIVWVSTNWLWFGTNLTTVTNDLSVTVSNAGTGTLTGSASTASPFSVIGASSYAITGTDTTNITVRYTRGTSANDTNELALSGGGGTNVHLSGVSTNAPAAGCTTARDNATGDSLGDYNFYDTAQVYFATKFVCSNNVASPGICTAKASLKHSTGANKTGTMKAAIFTHNSTVPGTIIGAWSDTVAVSTFTTSYATYTFENISMAAGLTATTTYWLVLFWSSDDVTDYPQWSYVRYGAGNANAISANGTDWTAYDTATQYFELFSQ